MDEDGLLTRDGGQGTRWRLPEARASAEETEKEYLGGRRREEWRGQGG